jgi:peptidyl-tRNA hydrolase
MKMYILLKNSVPDAFAPVIAAHASLACYKKYEDDTDMQQWMQGVFKKVVCRVNDKEFENAKAETKHVVLTEAALDHQEVCIVFCPRETYSKQFQFFPMWKPAAI